METIEKLLRISRSSMKALEYKGKTVEKLNEDALIDGYEILKTGSEVITIGVKNTGQIDRKLIKKLIETRKYIWHTIDSMSDGGRAVDVDLINPVTLRHMTGSSSATAINVLLGINDIGIGTDGGGSVLAPALSLNLFSIMAKGMGLRGNSGRVSTDGISFIPGVGVMSQDFDIAKDAILSMLDINISEMNFEGVRIAVPVKNSIALPDGTDMREKLSSALYRLEDKKADIQEVELPDFKDRGVSIAKTRELFEKFDLIITCEGPIDLWGVGDSVFGTMGPHAKSIQARSGKYMVKIANMVDATSITVPALEVAAGIVITARPGVDPGLKAIAAADELKGLYKMPDLYYDYFRNGILRRKNDIIFSLEGV